MNSTYRKYWFYFLVFVILGSIGYALWGPEYSFSLDTEDTEESGVFNLTGKAFGLDYQITYLDPENQNLRSLVDSIFYEWDRVALASSASSEIAILNRQDSLLNPSPELLSLFREASKWNSSSTGAYDPTSITLEKAWSFTSSGSTLLDTLGLSAVMKNVGHGKILLSDSLIRKPYEVKADFSKFLLGFAVDRIANLFLERGIQNFQIKLGEITLARGLNDRNELWKADVNHLSDSLNLITVGKVALQNKSFSTSGNPEQYYLKDSIRISFTLDPRTGLPVTHGLLSATVFSEKALEADVLADILMVLGKNEAVRMDSIRENVQMILIYNEKGGPIKQYISPDLKPFLSFPADF
jgi:FAD:protein FMN transferase